MDCESGGEAGVEDGAPPAGAGARSRRCRRCAEPHAECEPPAPSGRGCALRSYADELAFTPSAVGAARNWARSLVEASPAAAALPDVLLVLSELVTNALRHGSAPVRVRLTVCPLAVAIAVEDGGGGTPSVVRRTPRDEGGRGLRLVERLASSWAWEPLPGGGKSVRAEIALRP